MSVLDHGVQHNRQLRHRQQPWSLWFAAHGAQQQSGVATDCVSSRQCWQQQAWHCHACWSSSADAPCCYHYLTTALPFYRLMNRELVAWMPDEGSTDPNLFALEDSGESGWDQFAVNRKKFGYESGWSEDFYTTKLDKNK